MEALRIENVRKSFGQVAAVKELSVAVPAGSIYGFLGPNGAGKTTTIRMIMDIIRPDSGLISVMGNSALGGAVKQRIGYLPEERGLYRKMTVERTLAYFASIKAVAKRDIRRKVSHWLEKVQLDNWAGKKVEELSRGMHQKLQFAVTCINDPELLILDEPFTGLDPVNLDMLKEIIVNLREQGKTVIFSTHMMHEAEKLCDYIVLINKGRAVLDGSLAEIRSSRQLNQVALQYEGDEKSIAEMSMVKNVQLKDKQTIVTLTDGSDSQELLAELVKLVKIKSFEVKIPSLHEIFVDIVENN